MIYDEDRNFDENFEEDNVEEILSLKTKFIDSLITNKKFESKIDSAKTQGSISELLEYILNSFHKDEQSEIRLGSLDHMQIWSFLEQISKEVNKNLQIKNKTKEDLQHKTILKELNTAKKSLLDNDALGNKRNRHDEKIDDSKEELDEEINLENDGDDQEEVDLEENDNNDVNDKVDDDNLNDQFFNFDEFNKFADEPFDNNENTKKIDEFEEIEDDEEVQEKEEYKYEDFFDDPQTKKDKRKTLHSLAYDEYQDEEIEDNIFDIENKIMNKQSKNIIDQYEFVNKKIEQSIEEIENEMMKEKKWQMRGEITAKQRPKASLLENFLDFESTVKPPPIPDEEVASNIEKLIKLRIKDDLFDDPVRKEISNLNQKKQNDFELKFDKDKKGLAEIYEDDYNNKVMKVTTESEGKELKREIEELCSKVYTIFDKLTNNNFISGYRNTEMKVITNIPSIQLEEISNYVTDNKTFSKSANEMFSMKEAQIKTKEEMTTAQNKANHKKWKRNVRNKLIKKVNSKKLAELSKTVETKFEAKMALKQQRDKTAKKNIKNSELKSSKFFSNLQNLANEDISKKKNRENKKTNNDDNLGKFAKNYKL